MKAKDFLHCFQKIFIENATKAKESYYSNRAFTLFIIPKINEILADNGLETQNEYYRIDSIGWLPKSHLIQKIQDVRLNAHLWDLMVAVEHENDPHDWMDEVVKLAHICCPLRVVIGYIPWNKREFDLLYLDYVSRWLDELGCKDNMQCGEFLIILGNCDTNEVESRYFGYKGYLFNPEKHCFSPLGE